MNLVQQVQPLVLLSDTPVRIGDSRAIETGRYTAKP